MVSRLCKLTLTKQYARGSSKRLGEMCLMKKLRVSCKKSHTPKTPSFSAHFPKHFLKSPYTGVKSPSPTASMEKQLHELLHFRRPARTVLRSPLQTQRDKKGKGWIHQNSSRNSRTSCRSPSAITPCHIHHGRSQRSVESTLNI